MVVNRTFSQHNSRKLRPVLESVEMVKSYGLLPVLVTGSGQPSLLDKLDEPRYFHPDNMVTA